MSTTAAETKTPGLPAPITLVNTNPFKDLWTLTYKQGDNNRPKHLNFVHKSETEDKGDLLREVIQRARLFCEKTNRTFIVVTPFLTSLEDLEQHHLTI